MVYVLLQTRYCNKISRRMFIFKNDLWRKMTKKETVDYHPSLVWTEIISFIKGSVETLHNKCGYIMLEEYQTIGNKRAPSFTADRETIYEMFNFKWGKYFVSVCPLVYVLTGLNSTAQFLNTSIYRL